MAGVTGKVRADLHETHMQLVNSAMKANGEAIAARDVAEQLRQQLEEQLGDAPKMRVDAVEAFETAKAERFRAVDERRAAARLRAEAEEEKRRVEEQDRLEERQRALLERASDDSEGLNLRTKSERFEMDQQAMSADEKDAYERDWSKMLIAMARSIARVLERLREKARNLLASEKAADSRMAEAERREVEAERRAAEMANQKLAYERDQASHRTKVRAFEAREALHAEEIADDNRWRDAIVLAFEFPQMFEVTKEGSIGLTETGQRISTKSLQEQLQKTPPAWVTNAVKRLVATSALADQKTAEKLAVLDDMIVSAGPTLSPKQKETVSEARNVMKQFGMPPPGVER